MPKTPYIYKYKPSLNSIEDLLSFLEPIPPRYWCVDKRIGANYTHCVLGHLDNGYTHRSYTYSQAFTEIYTRVRTDTHCELARINNGEIDYANSTNRYPKADLSGKGAKSRVIRFLRGLIKRKKS